MARGQYQFPNTQIKKLQNTALIKIADWPGMCYIFEKVVVQGPKKQCSRVSDMQIQKKCTNTQIQLSSKLQLGLTRDTFLKKVMVQEPQNQGSQLSVLHPQIQF